MNDDPAKPTPAPIKLITEAITAAQGLVGDLEPRTDHETTVRHRTATLLSTLLTIVEAQSKERLLPAALVALTLNLEVHPDPNQAKHDHLIRPLLSIASVKSSRGVRAWQSDWLGRANDSVYGEIQAHRSAETTSEAAMTYSCRGDSLSHT